MPSPKRLFALGLLAAVALAPRAAMAQGVTLSNASRVVPTPIYFTAFQPFYEGEYESALKTFVREGRGAIKTVDTRWIDSICYHTMTGECHYQMGRYDEALTHYDSALRLYVIFADWLLRVQFDQELRPAGPQQQVQVPWGTSKRRALLAHYPSQSLIAQGRLNNNEQVRKGGVVQAPIYFPVNVQEIARAMTIALRRRRELMGPVCEQSQVTKDVLAALTRPQTQANHWSEFIQDVHLGMAYLAAGKPEQARSVLERSIVAGGQYEHPLTSHVLLELGHLALAQGNLDEASKYFEEASYSSVQYMDASVLEEAFRYGFLVHMLANRPGVYPPLEAAADWARVKNYRQLQASLTALGAENQVHLGNYREASRLVANARSVIGNHDMGRGILGARLDYVAAQAAFGLGDGNAGEQALAAATKFQQSGGSTWLYQIKLVDALFKSGAVSTRSLGALYDLLLREPTHNDWSHDPLEAWSFVATSHEASWENWLAVVLERREERVAFDIAELARRRRFLNSLPLAGRPLELRWLLDGPTEILDQSAQLERQDLLARFPAYADLSRQIAALRAAERAEPLVPAGPDAQRAKAQRSDAQAALVAQQDRLLELMSLGRYAAAITFPPQRKLEEIQAALPAGQAVLAFFATKARLYAYLITKDEYVLWPAGNTATQQKLVATLLRELGHVDGNRRLDAEQLASDGWRKPARALLAGLLEGGKSDFAVGLEELAIVPDGPLWYVPFEALPSTSDETSPPLVARLRIRYAPTVALAVPDGRGRRRINHTAVVLGRLFPRDSDSVAIEAFGALSDVLPGCVALPVSSPTSSGVAPESVDGVIAYQDLAPGNGGPYDWSPLPSGSHARAVSLVDWLAVGSAGPQVVVLPGFRTAAENGLKGSAAAGNGDDLFLPICGLMASGARTILISRWRTAGQTGYDLVREFTRELPHGSAANAWQRAVEFVSSAELNPAAEPRLEARPDAPLPSAEHPFFWAGYLLVDSGEAATDEELEDPGGGVIVPQAAALPAK